MDVNYKRGIDFKILESKPCLFQAQDYGRGLDLFGSEDKYR